MKQLSSLDAQFLLVESSTTTGHVGALLVLDPATAPQGEITLDDLRAMMEPRLHLVDALRERVVEVPLGLGHPYWIEDPDFDLEYHTREVALPQPGSAEQLAEQVARIHARPLDRTRPLWEMYLVHGLADDRAAVYAKFHHAAIDGISGTEILSTVLDAGVEPRVVDPPVDPWAPPPVPSSAEILARGSWSTVRRSRRLLTQLPRQLPHLTDIPGAKNLPGVRLMSGVAGALTAIVTGSTSENDERDLTAPPTPFNAAITAHRRFAYGSVPLADVKKVKNAFGLTVNDVVMAMTTTALRRWLLDHDALPSIPLIGAVPVSIRSSDEQGDIANLVSVMLARLPTDEADPGVRLRETAASMTDAKRRFEAVPATILQELSAAVPTALSGLAARSLFRLALSQGLPFNLFVSNVPGPQLPLYVAGARLEGMYPVSAVTDMTGGINITLFSYDGTLDFGIVVCREMVPDVWQLIDHLRDGLAELVALAEAPV
ncbi:MAG: wax ester/triacylglycerol synthase family O-acyltransferase [Actinomycetota bacterium]|nr:wax ester/triacylglycerol synthase family O-acyltransferase [Actinomycetota bacterium]